MSLRHRLWRAWICKKCTLICGRVHLPAYRTHRGIWGGKVWGMSNIEPVFIRDEMIRLGQFLKLANLVENGTHARDVIQDGVVKVNDEICEQRGKQLHPGDVVELNGMAVQVERD